MHYFLLQLILDVDLLLEFLGLIQQAVALKECNNSDSYHECWFHAEIWERNDADLLILNLYEGRANKHECPADDINEGDNQFILEVIFKVVYIHGGLNDVDI